MIEELLFQNSNWFWTVVFSAIGLWILLVWKEWSKPVTRHFYFSILIAFVTISSFALLALKPLAKTNYHSQVGLILTERFDQERLDSLKRVYKEIKVLPYEENLEIGKTLDSLSTIYVLGEGIAPFDFWQFENRPVVYLGTDLPSGIVDLKYRKENVIGEELVLKGRYHNTVTKSSLVLEDGDGLGIDSVRLNGNGLQEFELTVPLKAKGKFVFKLIENDSLGESTLKDPVPFQVFEKKNLKVLIVSGFPTFETKYFKNFMAEMGHEVVVRTQLTKGRYKFEYFNTGKIPIYSLGAKELEHFDLLVIEANSFKNLSRRTKSVVENSIKNEGLGLFIQPASSLFQRSTERITFQFQHDGISKTRLSEFPESTLEKLPFQFKEANGLEEIHSSNEGLLTAYKRMQKGRVGTTVLVNTYQLQLDGKTEVYRQLWTTIVNTLAKKQKLNIEWESTTLFPLENHPFKFALRTAKEKPLVHTEDGSLIALQQDIDLALLWNGRTYPKKRGWNALILDNESSESFDFYTIDSLSWRSLRAHSKQKENRRYFTALSQKPKLSTSIKSIELFWFFLIGLIGLCYLWLHPKLFRN